MRLKIPLLANARDVAMIYVKMILSKLVLMKRIAVNMLQFAPLNTPGLLFMSHYFFSTILMKEINNINEFSIFFSRIFTAKVNGKIVKESEADLVYLTLSLLYLTTSDCKPVRHIPSKQNKTGMG